MSAPVLHVNLFVDTERLSAAPVRLKVIAPLSAAFASGLVITAAFVIHAMSVSAGTDAKTMNLDLEALKPKFAEYEKLLAESEALDAAVVQVRCEKTGKYPIASWLLDLAEAVPPSIQFVSFNYEYPTLPRAMPFAPEAAPTNLTEAATVKISGKTSVHEDIAKMLASLQSESFTGIVADADIPRGSFRQESKRIGSAPDAPASLLFEINIDCVPRKFKEVSLPPASEKKETAK